MYSAAPVLLHGHNIIRYRVVNVRGLFIMSIIPVLLFFYFFYCCYRYAGHR